MFLVNCAGGTAPLKQSKETVYWADWYVVSTVGVPPSRLNWKQEHSNKLVYWERVVATKHERPHGGEPPRKLPRISVDSMASPESATGSGFAAPRAPLGYGNQVKRVFLKKFKIDFILNQRFQKVCL